MDILSNGFMGSGLKNNKWTDGQTVHIAWILTLIWFPLSFLRPSNGPARIINGFVRAQKYMVRGCR